MRVNKGGIWVLFSEEKELLKTKTETFEGFMSTFPFTFCLNQKGLYFLLGSINVSLNQGHLTSGMWATSGPQGVIVKPTAPAQLLLLPIGPAAVVAGVSGQSSIAGGAW